MEEGKEVGEILEGSETIQVFIGQCNNDFDSYCKEMKSHWNILNRAVI